MEDVARGRARAGHVPAGADRPAAASHRRPPARGGRRERLASAARGARGRHLGTSRRPSGPGLRPSRPARTEARRARSMRCPTEKVDRLLDAVGETVLHSRRLEHLVGDGAPRPRDDERIEEELGGGELLLDELQDSVIQLRTLPLSSITGPVPAGRARPRRGPATSRWSSRSAAPRHQLDRVILDGISESISPPVAQRGRARDRAARGARARRQAGARARRAARDQRGGLVAIEVADDGRGVAAGAHARGGRGRHARGRARRGRLLDRRRGHRRLRPRGRPRRGQVPMSSRSAAASRCSSEPGDGTTVDDAAPADPRAAAGAAGRARRARASDCR